MLRHSAAPLALGVFFLAACGGDGSDVVPPIDAGLSADPAPDQEPIVLTVTTPVSGATQSTSSGDAPRTLASLPENQDWTLIAKSPDGNGGFIGLRFEDNGNGDAAAFEYDEASGELTLKTPLDYERPLDADGDNKFELQFIAYEYDWAPPIAFSLDVNDQDEIFDDFPVVWVNGETQFGGLGRNLISLGDLDDDGLPDLALAAPGRHQRDGYSELPPADYHAAGELYVISSDVLADTTFLNLDEASGEGIWHLSGSDADLNVGYNMTLLGDLDEDGVDDFLVTRDESAIEVISGATLRAHMRSGDDSQFDDINTGTISLIGDTVDHKLDPRTFAPIGDLDGDGLTDLAFCTSSYKSGGTVEANVFTISGVALRDAMTSNSTEAISDLYGLSQAAYYVYSGNHPICGPLVAIGDVNDDALVDIAIPMPGPDAGDSGLLVFGGAELLGMLQEGGRHFLTAFDIYLGEEEPFTHFTDTLARTTEQHYMVTALGDVTGDGLDDFGFSWGRYTSADDSAYIVKGSASLLTANGETTNLRSMVASGGVIQLAATPSSLEDNEQRVEPIHALLAPEDGRHEALIFVGAGEQTSRTQFDNHSVLVGELPTGGTSIAPLPISGAGDFSIPPANMRQLSYATSIGDLNRDGYGDLAIGWSLADLGGAEDSGTVLLVSGKEIIERRNRGEFMAPNTMALSP